MWKQIDLEEVNKGDRFAPNLEYTVGKARIAAFEKPTVYQIQGTILSIDVSQAALPIEEIKECLRWGVQWNDR